MATDDVNEQYLEGYSCDVAIRWSKIDPSLLPVDELDKQIICFLIDGLDVNRDVAREHLSKSFGSAALLNPYLGYDTVAKIVKESLDTGRSIKELALKTGKVTESQFDEIMKNGVPGN